MNVGYFSNHFAARGGHGVARYSRSLFRALKQQVDAPNIWPLATWSNLPAGEYQRLVETTGLQTRSWGRRLTPLAWTYLNWPPVERWSREPLELIHLLAVNFPIATRLPLVTTVHDIGPLTHPQFFAAAPIWLFKRCLKAMVRQADVIVCVSQATADELETYLQRHWKQSVRSRVQVVHEGVEADWFEPVTEAELVDPPQLPEAPFLLTVGKLSPRKNVQGVLRALEQLADQIPHHLVAVGGSGWDDEEIRRQIESSRIAERVHLLGYVPDETLRWIYRGAAAYLHPSLFEGFGLTVLEAMACGCPVITSNVFSLPEVVGEAAVKVDPSSDSEIAAAILQVCTNSALSEQLRREGVSHARGFGWDRCAQQVRSIYDQLA